MSIIKDTKDDELISVFRDVCSDHLRNMLYELEDKNQSPGFTKKGCDTHKRLFQRLVDANRWFEGKNGLHYRNCAGAHLQPSWKAENLFQQFGYGGRREWKHLTKGVAACLAMMKLMDGGKSTKTWRDVRRRVAIRQVDTHGGLPLPNGIEVFLLDLDEK